MSSNASRAAFGDREPRWSAVGSSPPPRLRPRQRPRSRPRTSTSSASTRSPCWSEGEAHPALSGALGAPFLLEDPANQFLHLKRHIYLQDYWDPDGNPNMWGNTLADKAHETWTALKTIAQYYLNVNTFTFDMSTSQ
ncbi:uncharacterized protein C3orf85 homolog [Prionailurus viverrinus]|uniref:uncharacterized protein C3orf85 homolog n=1 Tax=Prionailurus viverrinus TaxID=61388 RepID=UPI001FF4387A|nr:uncharacterized protein C3orf85 homolog [Prionailurus viverrinus]